MDYINRQIGNTLDRLAVSFPIVLVTGPRQTGKSTLLKKARGDIPYLTFDDPSEVLSARSDPKTFLALHDTPLILDEIQYMPDLFPYLKMDVDRKGGTGLYYLTGSQQFSMMKNVSESLAGRIGILQLSGISLRERYQDTFNKPFLPTLEYIRTRKPSFSCTGKELWHNIHQSSYPAVVAGKTPSNDFCSAYVKTYIERDVRALTQVGDELQFMRFIIGVASRTGQLLNYHDLAHEVGISDVTAKKWLSILVTTGIVYLLRPYANNVEKRVVKTPKLYFLDTGLAAWLTKWTMPEVLESGAMAGHIFETFVVAEILKSWLNAGLDPPVYFYRDKDGTEIDMLIEDGGYLYPVEIRKTATPTANDAASFYILKRIKGKKMGSGVVVCATDKVGILREHVFSLPVSCL